VADHVRKPLTTLADRWDAYATQPDLYVCSEPETTKATVARIVDAMPAVGQVLDLGCGPGRLAVPVADAAPNLRIVGLDISPRMLARATYHPRVRYLLGDGEHALGPLSGAWSVLLFQHLTVGQAAGYLFDLAHHLIPGAPLLVQFVAGDHHADLDHRYRPTELVGLAEAAGLADCAAALDPTTADWWWLTARRPA
jgi:SAM-dependent methyltransferase